MKLAPRSFRPEQMSSAILTTNAAQKFQSPRLRDRPSCAKPATVACRPLSDQICRNVINADEPAPQPETKVRGGMSFFERLKAEAEADWRAYTEHPFTDGIADGTLPEAAFRHYLVQDYLFLIEFARAYALAIYKSPKLADMREAAAGLSAILDVEMDHLNLKLSRLSWATDRQPISFMSRSISARRFPRALSTPA